MTDNTTTPKTLPDGVTDIDVKRLVAEHKQVYPVTVEKDGKVYAGLFKKPSLTIMSAAAAAGTGDPMKAGQVLFNNCKLKVDAEAETDDEVKLAMINGVSKLFRILEAQVGEPLVAGE